MNEIVYTEAIDGQLFEVITMDVNTKTFDTWDVNMYEGDLFKHCSGSANLNNLIIPNDCIGKKEIWIDPSFSYTLKENLVSEECLFTKIVENKHISEEDFERLLEGKLFYNELQIGITHNEKDLVDEKNLEEIMLDIEKMEYFAEILECEDNTITINFLRDDKGFMQDFSFSDIETKHNVSITILYNE